MNWAKYRKWKHVITPLLVLAGLFLTRGQPADTLPWRVAAVFCAALVVAYIIEEIVWIMRGRGRPCVHCGKNIPIKSFRVHHVCPACGKEL